MLVYQRVYIYNIEYISNQAYLGLFGLQMVEACYNNSLNRENHD